MLSHSFTTGMHYSEARSNGMTKELINEFDDDFIKDDHEKRNLYSKYIASATGTRISSWNNLDKEDLGRIRNNFAEEGGSIVYRGCNVANPLHGRTPFGNIMFDVLNPEGSDKTIEIGGAAAGTQLQRLYKLDDGSQVWSFYELNLDGSIKKDSKGKAITAQVGINEFKSRTTRYWPSPSYHGSMSKLTQLFPEIDTGKTKTSDGYRIEGNSYLMITDVENRESSLPLYTVEYFDKDGNIVSAKYNQLQADDISRPRKRPEITSASTEEELIDLQRDLIYYSGSLTPIQRQAEDDWLKSQFSPTQAALESIRPPPTKPDTSNLGSLTYEEVKGLAGNLETYRKDLTPYMQYQENREIRGELARINEELSYRDYQRAEMPKVDTATLSTLSTNKLREKREELYAYRDLLYNARERIDREEYYNQREHVSEMRESINRQIDRNVLNEGLPPMPSDITTISETELNELIGRNREYGNALYSIEVSDRQRFNNEEQFVRNNIHDLRIEYAQRIAGRGSTRTRPHIPPSQEIMSYSAEQINELQAMLRNYDNAIYTLSNENIITEEQRNNENEWIGSQFRVLFNIRRRIG